MVLLGKWTRGSLEAIMLKASSYSTTGKRISYISSFFLGTPYKASTLTGSRSEPERFVINLRGMDCFTFIEYVEAFRLSVSFREFEKNLKKIRYRSEEIDFGARNHFFSDWSEFNKDSVDDVTIKAGGRKTISVRKKLNVREDGTFFLDGIPPSEREVAHIPSGSLTDPVIDKLKTGDYIGIYSRRQGLDVTHTGILIKSRGKTFLRHASSQDHCRKVVDQDFRTYIAAKPGIVVLRPK